jgi:hypothetical protein
MAIGLRSLLFRTLGGLLLVTSLAPAKGGDKDGQYGFGQIVASGYVQVQWIDNFRPGAYPAYTFDLRRLRLKFQYVPSDIGACVELACDRLTPAVENAYIQYKVMTELRFVAGLRKMPFSREELTSGSKLLMVEHAMTTDTFGNHGYLGHDIGFAVEGDVLRQHLGYAVGVYNGNGGRLARDRNNAKQFSERLTYQAAPEFSVGVSGTQRNDSLAGTPVSAYGADCEWKKNRWTVEGEVLAGTAAPGTRMAGAWVAGTCRLGAVEPGIRLERLYTDLSETGEGQTQLTFAGTWYPHRRLQIKANLVSDVTARWSLEPELILQGQVVF